MKTNIRNESQNYHPAWPTTHWSEIYDGRIHDTAISNVLGVYAPLVYLMGRGKGLNEEDAKDLAQEVMLVLFHKLKCGDVNHERGRFKGLVGTIARRLIMKFHERNNRREALSLDEIQLDGRLLHERLEDPNASIPGETDDREWTYAMIGQAMWRLREKGKLPDEKRAAFIDLTNGTNGQEVAARLGMSVGALYVLKNRVHANLRKELKLMQSEVGEFDDTPDRASSLLGIGDPAGKANSSKLQPLELSARTLDGGGELLSPMAERLRFACCLQQEINFGDAPAYLLYRDRDQKAKALPVHAEFIVGRAPPSELVLSAATRMSGKHFRVVATEDGYLLEDLNSRNGTFVNGSKVQRDELTSGDVIEAGAQIFCFIAPVKI